MIVAIGNSPSSGSTFLADLLDSLSFAVCGPEVGLFAPAPYFVKFARLQRDGFFSSKCPSCYTGRVALNVSRLHTYGLDKTTVRKYLSEVPDFESFCQRFFDHFCALRGKDARLCFEKTPQNIHTARTFLDNFSEAEFLHIVRNPVHVYKSLRRRGFPPYVAASAWLVDVSAAYALRDHPRFYTIRYEDLVQDPFGTVSMLAERYGEKVQKAAVKQLYADNRYRELYEVKLDSWSITSYGVAGNANRQEIAREDVDAMNFLLGARLSDGYASLFGLSEASFIDISRYYGYAFDDLPRRKVSVLSPRVSAASKLLYRKWLSDWLRSDASLTSLTHYLNPVITDDQWVNPSQFTETSELSIE